MTTVEAAKALNISHASLTRAIRNGCPAPARTWAAADLGRARHWLEAHGKLPSSHSGARNGDGLNAAAEARTFFKLVNRGVETVASVHALLSVSPVQRAVLLKHAEPENRGVLLGHIRFRVAVAREFRKLLAQAQRSR